MDPEKLKVFVAAAAANRTNPGNVSLRAADFVALVDAADAHKEPQPHEPHADSHDE